MNITTYRKEFQQQNCLTAEAGSNCSKGGDAGHGGRTILRLKDNGGTALKISVKDEHGRSHTFDQASAIELVFGGDSEHDTVMDALEFMLGVLKATTDAAATTESVD